MCLFVEKLLSLKKVCGRGPKGPQNNRPGMPLFSLINMVLRYFRDVFSNQSVWRIACRTIKHI